MAPEWRCEVHFMYVPGHDLREMPAVPFGGVTTATTMTATMITTMVVPAVVITVTLPSLLQDGIRYGTIVADPPWPETGGGKIKRGADRHYPLMKVNDIIGMAHAVRQLAKERSHLYLWTTNNHLPSALLVMWAWGFEYKTALTWMKTGNAGMGQYHQGLTEHVLFGVRGKPRKYRTLDGKKARGLTGCSRSPEVGTRRNQTLFTPGPGRSATGPTLSSSASARGLDGPCGATRSGKFSAEHHHSCPSSGHAGCPHGSSSATRFRENIQDAGISSTVPAACARLVQVCFSWRIVSPRPLAVPLRRSATSSGVAK